LWWWPFIEQASELSIGIVPRAYANLWAPFAGYDQVSDQTIHRCDNAAPFRFLITARRLLLWRLDV
jgi:hypothetical protein